MNQASSAAIIVGVDTHKLTHAAVALTSLGARLGSMTIPASAKGYRDLETWAKSLEPSRLSALRARDHMAPACRASCASRGTPFLRSDAQTANSATKRAKPITSMPKAPPAPCWAARRPPCRSPEPARSR